MPVDAESLPAAATASPDAPTPPCERPDKHTVHWFRKGLRLHDNPALREGLQNANTFRCVFIIDPWFAGSSNVGINKWRFLLQCLEDLDSSLRKLNSRLFVVRGQPADALPKLFREWGTTALTFEEDPEPFGRVRDHNIMTMCQEIGIKVVSRVSHTLYKLDKIIECNGGKAPLTYHQFQALIADMPAPLHAQPTISDQMLEGATTPVSEDHDDRFGVPTLEELGFDVDGLKPPIWIGGESEALARLERHLERKAWVASFGRPKMTPQSLLASQTGLSPYMRFGCLSTRLFYYQLTELYKRIKMDQPPLSLHGQLLWREFFYCAATRNPNFDRMVGNPICVQIPWDKNQEALAKWANGQTGFPWIDAIMKQLREEGWIHHLARHAVACFLTRGDLWISWEEGMKVFDELLLDADWSVNAGMWMWLSCSSFFQQFFHCYCPVRFGRKADPNGDYIRRYIPALKNMPTRYIHEPWMAPEAVQGTARCCVGRDYPLPMVDHTKVSQINIKRIKQVYTQLAKFRPQGPLTTQAIQRPNFALSSPSPTSVITSINQSNYLCSRRTDTSITPAPPYRPPQTLQQSTDVFHHTLRPPKTVPFKRVVIVTQETYTEEENREMDGYHLDVETRNKYENLLTLDMKYNLHNAYNSEIKLTECNKSVIKDNYNLRKLINDNVNPRDIYLRQQHSGKEIRFENQPTLKINYYDSKHNEVETTHQSYIDDGFKIPYERPCGISYEKKSTKPKYDINNTFKQTYANVPCITSQQSAYGQEHTNQACPRNQPQHQSNTQSLQYPKIHDHYEEPMKQSPIYVNELTVNRQNTDEKKTGQTTNYNYLEITKYDVTEQSESGLDNNDKI